MPHLKTEHLKLYIGAYHRGFHPEAHVNWLNDKELMKYSEQRHQTHTVFTQTRYLASFDHVNSFFWEIAPRDMQLPIGSITAYCDWPNKVAEIGILIGAFQQRGYGTEAWQAVCDWLFRKGIRKIEAGCMASNMAMRKVFSKTGMNMEGRRYSHFLLDGKPEDLILVGRYA